jgi:hypothetical protein
MKSKSSQKRIKRSFRTIKGGKPVTRSQVEMALVSAQNLVRELSSMLSLIEQQTPLPRLSIETNLESAQSLVTNLTSMLVTVKKETPSASSASAAVYTSSSAPATSEPEDWWKVGPNDRSGIGQGSIYADYV